MKDPVRTQTFRRAKRILLAPFPHLLQPWAKRPPASKAKAFALQRLIFPQIGASARAFERRLVDGRIFRGNTGDLLCLFVYVFGTWEPNLTAFIRNRLRPGDVFIDVGANAGWFTTLAAQIVGDAGSVVAIEASPLLAGHLQQNLDANSFHNVKLVNAAAGAGSGMVDIVHGPAEHTGLTRVVHGTEVACATLQALVSADDLARARLVKIDVEGAEFDVIEGLAPAFHRLSTRIEFVVEVGPERATAPSQVSDLFDRFERAGFAPYRLPNYYDLYRFMKSPVPIALERVDDLPLVETDIVFSRVDAAALPFDPNRAHLSNRPLA